MPDLDRLTFRRAGPGDAASVAALHADSWQRHYRGAYSAAFLDGDVVGDRTALWADRLRHPDPSTATVLALDADELVGFGHVILGDDSRWGALLDNLHVSYPYKRTGVGTMLMSQCAGAVLAGAPGSGLFLWVLEQNTAAQAFYEARGGTRVDRKPAGSPGGVPGRLDGSPHAWRYVWPDPRLLLRDR